MIKVIIDPLARDFLLDAHTRIAEDNPRAGKSFVDAFALAIKTLEEMNYATLKMLASNPLPKDYWILPVSSYLIFFRKQNGVFEIMYVLSSSDDIAKIVL